jgi:Probable cobalt transporter subunit (CbtB)
MVAAVGEKSVEQSRWIDVPLKIAIPASAVLPWAILGSVVMAIAFYFVGAEQGATSLVSGMGIHEFVHDARHLLGFPCH